MVGEIKKAKDVDPNTWVKVLSEELYQQRLQMRANRIIEIGKEIADLQAKKAELEARNAEAL